jgi:hypothetical protein
MNRLIWHEYWKIDCISKEHVTLSLNKLNMKYSNTTELKNSFSKIFTNIINFIDNYSVEKIYVAKCISPNEEEFWDWTNNIRYYRGKYDYKGKVILTKTELDAIKYNL